MKYSLLAIAVGLVATCGAAAQVSIITTAGTVVTEENFDVTIGGVTERQITLRAEDLTDSIVTIRAISGTIPVRHIYLKSVRYGSNQNHFVVFIEENGGTFSHIRKIVPVSASPGADAEVWLASINISGVLGNPGLAHSSLVWADILGDIRAGGGVTADVVSGPRLFGGSANIANIEASGGDISGDIYTSTGSITAVTTGANLT